MNRIQKSLILSGCLLSLCSSAAIQPVLAQRSSQVQFKPGNYGTMLGGTITGREYIDYKLTGKASARHPAGHLVWVLIHTMQFLLKRTGETLVRAQGRCKLTSGGYQAFNGHSTFKHKQAGGTDFVFSGPNTSALQVQTYSGIKNVRHNEKPLP